MFTISWINVKSALVSGFITAFIGMAGYLIQLGDVSKIDYHALINIGVMSGLVTIVSALKALATTDSGNFMGAINIK